MASFDYTSQRDPNFRLGFSYAVLDAAIALDKASRDEVSDLSKVVELADFLERKAPFEAISYMSFPSLWDSIWKFRDPNYADREKAKIVKVNDLGAEVRLFATQLKSASKADYAKLINNLIAISHGTMNVRL